MAYRGKLLAAGALAAVAAGASFPGVPKGGEAVDCSNWMAETLTGRERMTEIALLGAHDALSEGIRLTSAVDRTSADPVFLSAAGTFAKGFGVRQSRTQLSGASALLRHGVRYLDIRVSWNGPTADWYTVHHYFSAPLEDCLREIAGFLGNHPGEVAILDFQHCYDAREKSGRVVAGGFRSLLETLERSGVLGYALPDVELASATYGELTAGKTRSAALLLMKYTGGDPRILPYEGNIDSEWFNTDCPERVFARLSEAAGRVRRCGRTGCIGVQQAVLTMDTSAKGLARGLAGWSLLRRAAGFGRDYLRRPFEQWLDALPVVMLDYADFGDVQPRLMKRLLDYNRTLFPGRPPWFLDALSSRKAPHSSARTSGRGSTRAKRPCQMAFS